MRLSFKNWANIALCLAVGVLLAGPSRAVFAQSVDAAVGSAQVDAATLQKEVEKLRLEKEAKAQQVEEMRQEREQFVKEIRRVENLNQRYIKEIDVVKGQMSEQQKDFELRLNKVESDVADSIEIKQKSAKVVEDSTIPSIPPTEVERQAFEVMQRGGDLDPEDEKFKEELARAHYNMGNVYFERGEYQRSVVEYYQAVDLMPYDADAHYNLAFVSGEFIGDQETALKHYQWYLYLKPKAEDRKLVDEKIVAAKLHGRSKLPMMIDNPEKTGHLNVAR